MDLLKISFTRSFTDVHVLKGCKSTDLVHADLIAVVSKDQNGL